MAKLSKFQQTLTASSKTIKGQRAVLIEQVYINELDAELTALKREKSAIEMDLTMMLDISPKSTTSLVFGGAQNATEAKETIVKYHNLKLRLATEINPSIKIYEDLLEGMFTPIEIENEE